MALGVPPADPSRGARRNPSLEPRGLVAWRLAGGGAGKHLLALVATLAVNAATLVGLALLVEVGRPAAPEPRGASRSIPLVERPKRKRAEWPPEQSRATAVRAAGLPALDLPSSIQAPSLREAKLDTSSILRPAVEQDRALRSDGELIMSEELVDEPPRAMLSPAPRYPPAAERQGVEGTVELKVLVDSEGRVRQVLVERGEPAGLFDAAAVEAVERWRFVPARYEGRAVEVWARQRVAFKLR